MKKNSSASSFVPQVKPPASDLSAFATPDTKEMKTKAGAGFDYDLIKVPPFHYMHLLDLNTNVIRVIEGPCRYTRLDHEKVILGPEPMVIIPPRHFVVVDNPVIRNEKGELVFDKYKQVKLRHGEQEIRTSQDPFPLYPGERLNGPVQALMVVAPDTALRLRALCDFLSEPYHDIALEEAEAEIERGKSEKEKEKGKEEKRKKEEEQGRHGEKIFRRAGEEWLLPGPCTYVPRVEVEVRDVVNAIVVKPDQAIHLRALTDFTDSEGKKRRAGEEWLMRKTGCYLPGVNEKVIGTPEAFILTEDKVLHLRAKTSFVDVFGTERKAGEEWLVGHAESEIHIADVYEEVVGVENIITLTQRQYCVIVNPVEEGVPQLGKRKLVKGPKNFFLLPGEALEENKVKEAIVLMADQALSVWATEEFDEITPIPGRNGQTTTTRRSPGNKWLVYGPREYVPPLQVGIISRVKAIIALEGLNIYVFNIAPIILAFIAFLVLLYLFLTYRVGGGKKEL